MENISKFGRKAVHSYKKRGFTGAIITGEFSKGKTCTAIYMATEIYMYLYNLSKKEAMKIVLDNMFFSMDDVIALTEKTLGKVSDWKDLHYRQVLEKKYQQRIPVCIWDDAGVHASSQKQRFEPGDSFELQSNYDTIRDITSCMILTVPENNELMSFLRNYRVFFHVEIIRPSSGGEYDRVLEFWKYELDKKTGRRIKRLKWRSARFSVYVPNEIYGEYDRRRTIAKIINSERWKIKKEQREVKKKYRRLKMEKEMVEMQKYIAENNINLP